jgi:antitoxin (DNA-binding transcriptional repressor) of toxin-antitoxin stability system
MAPRTRTQSTPVSSLAADALQRALHALGEYAHVAVRAERGHLSIFIDDGAPVARVTPLGANQYGLSFHSHTGRWETMPFVGELVPLAHDLVTALGPYLDRPDFSGGIRGSGH